MDTQKQNITDGMRPVGQKNKKIILIVFAVLSVVCLAIVFLFKEKYSDSQSGEEFTASTFVMDTLVTQRAYGANATEAMEQVNIAFSEYQSRLSMFEENSEIGKINASAGGQGVEVSAETVALLQQAKELAAKSENTFQVTIEPLTAAWGITTDNPRVVPQQEVEELLPLVDDDKMQIENNIVTLPEEGMGIDLGAFAKGAACKVAQEIYEEYEIQSALLSIGGNIYVKGKLPSGKQYRVGFRDPNNDANSYIASFCMEDEVIAVSGGYERYFEKDGNRYIHIIDPRTGFPAESDIISVGAITEDGAVADYYSTVLFVSGKERTLEYMRQGLKVIMLDDNNTLYVSASLQDSFVLNKGNDDIYTVEFVEAEA